MAELSGQGLTVIRGDRCLFEGVDFALKAGEFLIVEGPNGSGKTTMLRAIAGLIEPDEGTIRWNDTNVKRIRQAFHGDLVWMAHRPGFKGDLTLMENLRFEAGLRKMNLAAAGPLLARLGVAAVTEIPFRALSAGQQRRVALARLIIARARLWLMDEPFTNLDTAGQGLVLEALQEHLRAGGMCVMATHRQFDLDAPMHRIHLQ